uniref:Transmembrane protein n=1 Tax=Cucumis melo TaxID=3656 RepID=A0A9I9EJD4_CUCME
MEKKRREKKGDKGRKIPIFFSSSLSLHRQVSLIHFFTNFFNIFLHQISEENSKGRRLRKKEEEVQRCMLKKTTSLQDKLLYNSLNKSRGQFKGVMLYAIVGVVLFQGISEIIHRESEFHVFRLYSLSFQHVLPNFQAEIEFLSRQISIEKSVVGRLHVVFRSKLADSPGRRVTSWTFENIKGENRITIVMIRRAFNKRNERMYKDRKNRAFNKIMYKRNERMSINCS